MSLAGLYSNDSTVTGSSVYGCDTMIYSTRNFVEEIVYVEEDYEPQIDWRALSELVRGFTGFEFKKKTRLFYRKILGWIDRRHKQKRSRESFRN